MQSHPVAGGMDDASASASLPSRIPQELGRDVWGKCVPQIQVAGIRPMFHPTRNFREFSSSKLWGILCLHLWRDQSSTRWSEAQHSGLGVREPPCFNFWQDVGCDKYTRPHEMHGVFDIIYRWFQKKIALCYRNYLFFLAIFWLGFEREFTKQILKWKIVVYPLNVLIWLPRGKLPR